MRYAAGNTPTTGARQSAVGSAFHGSTNNDRLTFEKPALNDERGNMVAVPAIAYGRNRQVDMGRTPTGVFCAVTRLDGIGRSRASAEIVAAAMRVC
mmetsp:Transcript_120076/g.345212  ORF Transcript_120076/g.345212 Transcript_120076/m.345212 type:complete len:96 (+) Transcript_120076:372-659(+)